MSRMAMHLLADFIEERRTCAWTGAHSLVFVNPVSVAPGRNCPLEICEEACLFDC